MLEHMVMGRDGVIEGYILNMPASDLTEGEFRAIVAIPTAGREVTPHFGTIVFEDVELKGVKRRRKRGRKVKGGG